MDQQWMGELAAALQHDDEAEMLTEVRSLLGPGARVTAWRPTAAGWVHLHGDDDVPMPDTVLEQPGVTTDGARQVLRAGADPTTSRLVVVQAPAVPAEELAVVAGLLRIGLGRLVERRATAAVGQRLDDNERIGRLGSYDWHVPTDTNRWSDELYRIYGEEPQSFNASYERFISFIHPDDRDKVRAIHQRAFETGEPYEMEERIVLRDGSERLLWSNGEVIMGPDGTPERFIGICRDVTEQRAAEDAAAAAKHLRQQAHDAEIRRRAALELNDVVVQGLTAAAWATESGAEAVARDVLDQTLQDARAMMDDLLVDPGGEAPAAGELRRSVAPQARIGALVGDPRPRDRDPGGGDDRRRVVLADDAPDVRLLLSLQLDEMGLDVVGEAATGREAVALVHQHAPDIVLLDLSMPEMDGLEAATEIRAARPDMTIVVVSGYAAATMEPRARAAGADAYVEKGRDLRGRLGPLLEVPV